MRLRGKLCKRRLREADHQAVATHAVPGGVNVHGGREMRGEAALRLFLDMRRSAGPIETERGDE